MNINYSKHSQSTFQKLGDTLDQFDMERTWVQLAPSDLAKSIIMEAAELLEHFQWDDTLKNRDNKVLEKDTDSIKNEVADILIYLMKFCREMNIDIVDATAKKLTKLAEKYPIDYKKNGGHEEYLRIKKQYRENKTTL